MSDKAIKVLRVAWENVDGNMDSDLVQYLIDKVMAEGENTYVTGTEILDLVADLVLGQFKDYEKPKPKPLFDSVPPVPGQGIFLGNPGGGVATLANITINADQDKPTLVPEEYPYTEQEWNDLSFTERQSHPAGFQPTKKAKWCGSCRMWH